MGAMALALSNIHFDAESGKLQIGIGLGRLEGVTGHAVSVGRKLNFAGKPLFSISATGNSHGGNGVGGGFTFGF
jgi:autotransporter adhesin